MRRVALAIVLILAGSIWPATGAVAGASAATQPAPGGRLQADFDNDGADDLAVGVPGEDVGSVLEAGAVNVLYGSPGGVTGAGSQLFTQVAGAVEDSDFFGNALASGDFNNDGFADLAAAAFGEDVGSVEDAGAVSVLYGSANGLTTSGGQLFTQPVSAVEAGDEFGFSLTTGDFDNDGADDLAVGAPTEDIGSTFRAGAVSVLYGSAGGLTRTGAQTFTQPVSAVEAEDVFGGALASGDFNNDTFDDLAAGAPTEDVGRTVDAGAVSVLYGSASGVTRTGARTFTQPVSAVEFADEFGSSLVSGEFNDDDFADLAVGAPTESVGSTAGAGAVSVLYGSGAGVTLTGAQTLTQPVSAVETEDFFGDTLASGDFNNDGLDDLAAGAPFEDVGRIPEAGAVSALYGAPSRLSTAGAQTFTQVGSAAEAGDRFGDALATGDFDNDGFADLAAGAPSEDVGSIVSGGAVSVLYGSAGRLSTSGGQLFTQNSAGVPSVTEAVDSFGAALATGDPGPAGAAASSAASTSSGARAETSSH